MPPKHNDIVWSDVQKMLNAGIIQPASSAWSFPVVLASNPDGTHRFCVDYRKLNKLMVADRLPLPRVDEILEDLSGSESFTSIDLSSGYWQIRMDEVCKAYTAFVCKYGTF